MNNYGGFISFPVRFSPRFIIFSFCSAFEEFFAFYKQRVHWGHGVHMCTGGDVHTGLTLGGLLREVKIMGMGAMGTRQSDLIERGSH